MFVADDLVRLQKNIQCARLELATWDFLNPAQQKSLAQKIRQFEQQLVYVEQHLERS